MTSTSLNIVLSNAKQCIPIEDIYEVTGSLRFRVDRYEIRVPPDKYGNEFESEPLYDYPFLIKLLIPEKPKVDLTFTLTHNRESTSISDEEVIVDFSPPKKGDISLHYKLYQNVENTNAFITSDDFLLDPNIQVVITLVPIVKKWRMCNVN